MSNSLRLHGLQQARLPFSSPTPRACSSSCPSSRWCHQTISSSVIPFSFCLQYFPHQGLFQGVSSSYQVAFPFSRGSLQSRGHTQVSHIAGRFFTNSAMRGKPTYIHMCVCAHACVCVLSHFSHVRLFITPWTISCQSLLSMGFSRQEHSVPYYLPSCYLTAWSTDSNITKHSFCDHEHGSLLPRFWAGQKDRKSVSPGSLLGQPQEPWTSYHRTLLLI